MSRNYYSEINLHIVWHTKESFPMLTPAIEAIAHRCIKKRIMDTPGAFVHAIGGTETHVHIVVTLAPTVTPSEFIGALKGGSAHDVNQQSGLAHKAVQWQAGYGVVSFGTRDMPWVKNYVENQKAHHAAGKVFDRLERITHEDDGTVAGHHQS